MRKVTSPEVQKHLLSTVEKNLNDLDVRSLAERLRDAVHVPPGQGPAIREPNKLDH